MCLQPGFQMGTDDLRLVMGYEVNLYAVSFLQCAQHLRGARVRFPIADAPGVEDAVEDGGRYLLAVGVEDVGPGGDCVRIKPLVRVPNRGIHVHAEKRIHGSNNSSIGIASVRPDAGSTTA